MTPTFYQCADCGIRSDEPFADVYQLYTGTAVIRRCPECAARWDAQVEPELNKVSGNGFRKGGRLAGKE